MTAEIQYQSFRECFWGTNGFEELKKYMRVGNEFCRDLASILTERAENEITYSKSLNKTSNRLQTLSKENFGDLSDAWLKVGIQFNIESEMHKALASALQEEIIKPLKILAENQLKCRKPVESKIEKVIKNLTDKRADDYKYRSRCFQLSKDIEKAMYSLDEAQKGVGGKPPNQKEIQKIEAQIVKSKELLDKSEIKYHKACADVELARQDWQIEMIKGCTQLETIEYDRLSSLDNLIKKLTIQINLLAKKMTKIVDDYQNINIDIDKDIRTACKKYGNGKNEQEINLYDIYAENTKNMMNRDRRIENLKKWAALFKTDLQAQIKSRQGLEKMRTFAKENPNFNANNDGDVALKLESVQLFKTLFDASLYKVETALAELLDGQKPSFEYSNLLNTIYDKQGVAQTTIKLNSSLEINTLLNNKPSAPSPPISPTQSISSSIFSSTKQAPVHISNNSISVPLNFIQMPTPYNLSTYDSGTGNYAGGESSSASSISTSSVSPAALSSSSSTNTATTSNDTQSTNSKTLNSKSSYLLTTVDHPPPYPIATLKRQTAENNSTKNSLIENYYNNSIQSSSDVNTQLFSTQQALQRPPSSEPLLPKFNIISNVPNLNIVISTLKPDNFSPSSSFINDYHFNSFEYDNLYNQNNSTLYHSCQRQHQPFKFPKNDDDWNETYKYIGKCTAQYDFKATRDDELTIFLGDQINIIEKREDGWWRGELRNSIGLFPSTYVKE